MTTYKLVHNEDDIRTFFNFIHDSSDCTGEPRQVITQILARKKYAEKISKSTRQIVRRLNRIHSGDELVKILKQYEVKEGLYSCKDIDHNEYILKNENLSVYATINKLDPFKAAKKLISSIHNQMFEACTNGRVQNLHAECGNIDRNFMSHMMSCSGYDFIHFDIDDKKEETISKIKKMFQDIIHSNPDSVSFPASLLIETTNGYHLLVNVRKEFHKKCIEKAHKMLPALSKEFEVSITDKGSPCPIPGTYQAGFPVKIVYISLPASSVIYETNVKDYSSDKGFL